MQEKPKIIYVEWVDSVSFGGGSVWTSRQDLVENAPELGLCTTVGFLLRETDQSIMIAGHISDHQASGDICIPKAAIKKRKTLTL